jgi:hypothetical protein
LWVFKGYPAITKNRRVVKRAIADKYKGAIMSEKLKASRYNHFVEQEDGKYLAFNALSCGLGELDAEKYRQ